MYAGRIVERAPVQELFARPRHPYTAGLLAAMPRLDRGRGRLATIPGRGPAARSPPARLRVPPPLRPQHRPLRRRGAAARGGCGGPRQRLLEPRVMGGGEPLLEVEGLVTTFPLKGGGRVRAVNGVDLELRRGETLAIVGESGCGKSTLARSVLRLIEPSDGRVRFAGQDVLALGRDALRRLRRDMQLVFQDPMASLDPRFTVGRSLLEPFVVHGVGTQPERRARVDALLRTVGLEPAAAARYPHEFSGGQRQRIGIARAIALEPSLVVLDEPVSALDVSIRSQILNLLQDLKDRLGLSYLFISHDLGVVYAVADRVAVMYLGRIVEVAPVDQLFDAPAHPYTQALLTAVPQPDPTRRRRRIVAPGEPPSPERPPSGCPFHPRCMHAMEICRSTMPEVSHLPGAGHMVRCHLRR